MAPLRAFRPTEGEEAAGEVAACWGDERPVDALAQGQWAPGCSTAPVYTPVAGQLLPQP